MKIKNSDIDPAKSNKESSHRQPPKRAIGPKEAQKQSLPKGSKQPLPRWLMITIFGVVVVLGAWLFTPKGQTKPAKPASTTTQVKPKAPAVKTPAVASPQKTTAPKTSKTKPENLTKPIQQFFTAYQQYDTAKQNPAERAKVMRKYGTADAVASLIPKHIQNQADQTSMRAVYTLTGPVHVMKNANSDDTYAVTLSYKVEVNGHSNRYTDSYTVTASHHKVTNTEQTSSVTE